VLSYSWLGVRKRFQTYALISSNIGEGARRPTTSHNFKSVTMKRILIGGISLAIIGTTTFGLLQWRAVEKQIQDVSCTEARHTLKGVEIRARALAAEMTVEAYAHAEEEEVAKLIRALESATSPADIDSVMASHAAAIEAEDAAVEAEVDARGDQAFLEQRLKKQRIPVDVKQQLERAAKAVSLTCR
jgi:hypothetical protein